MSGVGIKKKMLFLKNAYFSGVGPLAGAAPVGSQKVEEAVCVKVGSIHKIARARPDTKSQKSD